MTEKDLIAVVGSGAMGSGIAQVAASRGHEVCLYDNNQESLQRAESSLNRIVERLVAKGKMNQSEAEALISRIRFCTQLEDLSPAKLVIEAIHENLEVKRNLFEHIELMVDDEAILATNTSSLSIASLASACAIPERFIGIHFFNPAPLMPLVEIIPGVQTSGDTLVSARNLIDSWGKTTVIAKDTPGFIVNRVARPFYGEAIRIYEEGIADVATIDWAVKEIGQFRMGPFELMDYIGNDVNYAVTESVFASFYYDARYRPAFTQKRMVEAGWLGRKTERGYYDYRQGAEQPSANHDQALGEAIVRRILLMLINEAVEALHLHISTREGIDIAMTKGVNYPKGLLRWADELGVETVLTGLDKLYADYGEDRYRASILLRRMADQKKRFYPETIFEN